MYKYLKRQIASNLFSRTARIHVCSIESKFSVILYNVRRHEKMSQLKQSQYWSNDYYIKKENNVDVAYLNTKWVFSHKSFN